LIEDISTSELQNNHRLHDNVLDDVYNPESMEINGAYPEEVNWTYEDIPREGINEDLYNCSGPGPCLRPYIAKGFLLYLRLAGLLGGK
jgi:hypothetical protein